VGPEEIDSALDELENRLDRLRSLYEQYFIGIEKIEPAIARKDVDRRIWILRRTQIRNTMRRFRLQTLIQRYNTFQQYWTRICREIENGTYVRHMLKAKKNFGAEPKTWAAKKRLGLFRRDKQADGPAEASPSQPPAAHSAPPVGASDFDSSEDTVLKEPTGQRSTFNAQATLRATKLEDLGPLDLDFDDAPTAIQAKAPAPKTLKTGSPVADPKLAPPPAPTAPAERPANAAPKPATGPIPNTVLRTKPALPTAKATPLAQPSTTKPQQPPAPAPAAPAARLPVEPAPAARPAPVQRPAARPAEAADSGGVSDERLRQLHAELVATRRKLNQADNVSIDSLGKSLRETATKLRAAHQGRAVDFQVIVKDGKPVVKPVVRK
jgi:hypothetical protein